MLSGRCDVMIINYGWQRTTKNIGRWTQRAIAETKVISLRASYKMIPVGCEQPAWSLPQSLVLLYHTSRRHVPYAGYVPADSGFLFSARDKSVLNCVNGLLG